MSSILSSSKICSKCGQEFPATREYFYWNGDKLRPDCIQCTKKRHKIWYADRADEICTDRRQRYAENPEKAREIAQRYFANHPDKKILSDLRWREAGRKFEKAHPEEQKIRGQKRRARKRNAEGTYKQTDIELQIKAQTNKRGQLICWWCDNVIKGKYHVDHRIPLSKGGTNWPDNLCIAHEHCNVSKYDNMPWEFNGRLI